MSMNRKRWLREFALAERRCPDVEPLHGPNMQTLEQLVSLSWPTKRPSFRKLHRRRGLVCRPLFRWSRPRSPYLDLQAQIDSAIARVVLGVPEVG